MTSLDLTYNADLYQELVNGNVNQAYCTNCKKLFRHEVPLLVFHGGRQYAILADAREHSNIIRGKTQLLHLFGYQQFRFRSVRYCIEAIEKVRIFQDNLDDRAIECVKYHTCPPEIMARKGSDLLLYDGFSDGLLSFCIYDDFDQKTDARFTVPFIQYQKYSSQFPPEQLNQSDICWKRIDADWVQMQKNT